MISSSFELHTHIPNCGNAFHNIKIAILISILHSAAVKKLQIKFWCISKRKIVFKEAADTSIEFNTKVIE